MKANFFTKSLANILDFAVIFRLMQSENKTTYELIIILNNFLIFYGYGQRIWKTPFPFSAPDC